MANRAHLPVGDHLVDLSRLVRCAMIRGRGQATDVVVDSQMFHQVVKEPLERENPRSPVLQGNDQVEPLVNAYQTLPPRQPVRGRAERRRRRFGTNRRTLPRSRRSRATVRRRGQPRTGASGACGTAPSLCGFTRTGRYPGTARCGCSGGAVRCGVTALAQAVEPKLREGVAEVVGDGGHVFAHDAGAGVREGQAPRVQHLPVGADP